MENKSTKWISVSDHLPKCSGKYATIIEWSSEDGELHHLYEAMYYSAMHKAWNAFDSSDNCDDRCDDVIYWMEFEPMPEGIEIC